MGDLVFVVKAWNALSYLTTIGFPGQVWLALSESIKRLGPEGTPWQVHVRLYLARLRGIMGLNLIFDRFLPSPFSQTTRGYQ